MVTEMVKHFGNSGEFHRCKSGMNWMIGGLAFIVIAFPMSLRAQETVSVEKDRGLVGLWRIEVPESFNINLFQSAHFGPERPIYCRVREPDDIRCLSGGYSARGTITQEGNKVHVAWGSMMARVAIDADIVPGGFVGTFTFKLSGIRHDAPAASIATRLEGVAGGVDAPGDPSQENADVGRMVGSALPELGPVVQVAYLGTSPSFHGGSNLSYLNVYAVEFDNGERICGLHGHDLRKCI